jgi:hypothetical protein
MVDSLVPGVLWIPTSIHFAGRDGQAVRWLILHGTAGGTDAVAVANYLKSTEGSANPAGVHYVIGQDGKIVQMVAESNAAWGNGVIDGVPAPNLGFRTQSDGVHRDSWWNPSVNPNNVTISIEHCKPSINNSDALTPAQQAASFALTADICKRNPGIPMRFADASGGATGHFSIDAVSRQHCPGPYPWDALWAYLASQGGQDMPLTITDPFAAKHFKETSPTSWLCTTTGCTIVGAILDKWRATQGMLRLPKTNEIYNVIPGGSFQVYEAGVWVWDPQHKLDDPGQGPVYIMHLDQDTPGLRKLMAFAGLSVPAITQAEIDTAINAFKSAQASLAVGVTALEPIAKP